MYQHDGETGPQLTVEYTLGADNCETPQGLVFCDGLVDYETWKWDNSAELDSQAECLYDYLHGQFYADECTAGLDGNCEEALRRFACFETFKACDDDGFVTRMCQVVCDAVVFYCNAWFESVELPQYNCSSDRYVDSLVAPCTGNAEGFVLAPGEFPNEPIEPYLYSEDDDDDEEDEEDEE